eukprot:1161047-Pelagomonas_calceolata.AAC.21
MAGAGVLYGTTTQPTHTASPTPEPTPTPAGMHRCKQNKSCQGATNTHAADRLCPLEAQHDHTIKGREPRATLTCAAEQLCP